MTSQPPAQQRQPSSSDAPWSVATVNTLVKSWVERLGHVWVEGEILQLNMRSTWKMSYITLQDTAEKVNLPLTVPSQLLQQRPTPLAEGARVVVHGKPVFYAPRGSFSLQVSEIREVGIGEILARIEKLKRALAAEGLFDPRLKRPLPRVPHCVGLITGRGSDAEQDVLQLARQRWPEVDFCILNTAVQGHRAVPEIIHALHQLDADPLVDVIIVARGGGSAEDLLPFSEEQLVRCVAQLRTPVVSAIGHEPDRPILDEVADYRARTPTHAAKEVVPDAQQERMEIVQARRRCTDALYRWVTNEKRSLDALRSRPVLANPQAGLLTALEQVDSQQQRATRAIQVITHRLGRDIAALKAQVKALGPAQVLERGYSIVQVLPRDGGEAQVAHRVADVQPGSQLRIRVSDGSITAAALAVENAPGSHTREKHTT